jgi:hypothetical protein
MSRREDYGMDAELLKLTDQIFTAGARALIEEAKKYHLNGFFRCPVTGRKWAVADADKAEQIICKAKLAQLSWGFTSPDWAPSVLPVHADEIFAIVEAAENEDGPFTDALVGSFARSLAHSDFNFTGHPGIIAWVQNFLSLRPDMRAQLRNLELTPKPLEGFNRRTNLWEPPVPTGMIETGFARRAIT